METNQSNNILKKKNWKKIFFSIFAASIFTWAGLTKAGFLPNFLGIKVFYTSSCPPGMIMESWAEDYNGEVISVAQCVFSYPCPAGKTAKPWCGALPDEMRCSLRCLGENEGGPDLKPVIYLYPEQKQNIQVKLDYNGEIFADYPKYDEKLKGWSVTAYPDGKIINHSDNQEYSYLFWEGKPQEKVNWDLSKGFIVRGEDTKEFLQQTLSKIGLTPKEYNEFIVYWFPLMQDNKYNLIHFADTQYTDNAPLTIDPQPDSLLRVFMVYKPLETRRGIEAQEIKPFERKGFTVIEWGGTKVE